MDIMKRGGLDTQSYRIVSAPITGQWYFVKWSDGLEQWKHRSDVNSDLDYTMAIFNTKVGS